MLFFSGLLDKVISKEESDQDQPSVYSKSIATLSCRILSLREIPMKPFIHLSFFPVKEPRKGGGVSHYWARKWECESL